MCQANFILPALVLFSNPLLFLVVIQLFTIFGLIIAFKKKERRLNSCILALYPSLFHATFIIFYWAPSMQILVFTEIVCFIIFVGGMIHHILVMLYDLVTPIIKIIIWLCKRNHVTPNAKAKNVTRDTCFR